MRTRKRGRIKVVQIITYVHTLKPFGYIYTYIFFFLDYLIVYKLYL
jgi:hypothetical protein